MGNSTLSPTPPPTAPSVHYTTLNLGLPQKALSAPIIGTIPDSQMLHVNVTLKVDQATLNQLGATTSMQASKAGPHPDLARKLGISDENLKKIQAYFGVEHITVQPDKTRTNLTFAAQAGSVARLLQTKFVIHQLNGRKFFTPDPNHLPQIPAVIADYILAITGLDNYSLPPQNQISQVSQQSTLLPTHSQGDATCLNTLPRNVASEDRIAHAYGYDRFWNAGWHGENMTVNMVEIGGFDASATVNYWECVGSTITMDEIPMTIVPQPSPENTLDIEMLSALTPNIHLNDYEMDQSVLRGTAADFWTAFNATLQRIINDNQTIPYPGSAVSISLGAPESDVTTNVLAAVNQSIRILTQAEHMTVLAPSGDCGAYGDGRYGGQLVSDFPASSPWSVSVGGTQANFASNGTRANEVVWSDRSNLSACNNLWGSGGGLSQFFEKATIQQGPGVNNHYSTGKRQVPDISAVGMNVPIYYQRQWVLVDGTSIATPIWAAGMALVNEGLYAKKGEYFYGPVLFYYIATHSANLHPYYDVTIGDNLYYKATPGWDYASGWGTPNLADFFTILSNVKPT